jgi:ubiquinone biosynthesis protein
MSAAEQSTTDGMDWVERMQRVGHTLDASFELVGNVLGHAGRLLQGLREDSAAAAQESERLYQLVAEKTPAIGAMLRSTPRMARIVKEGVRMAAGYRIHAHQAAFLKPEVAAQKLGALHEVNAQRLRDLCMELGGGILKAGQFLSCRVDVLPEAYVKHLSCLQDQAPTISMDAIRERIEEEIGRPIEKAFAAFDETPLAAASLAQVHAARLHDGTEVVIKVQLPGVDTLVQTDMTALRLLADVVGDAIPGTDLKTIATALEISVLVELDYEQEAQNTEAFGAQWAEHPDILVPQVIGAWSTDRILCLTRIQGERLLDYLNGCTPTQRDRVLELLIGSYCEQVLDNGFFQADPHPGNFLVCPGPKLAMVDFGSVQRFSTAERRAYAQLAGAIMTRDTVQMADLFVVLGFETRNGDPESLIRFSEMLLEAFSANVSFDELDLDPQDILGQVMDLARANPVSKIPRNFVQLGRVFGALSGLLLHYKPRINLLTLIAPPLSRAMNAQND